MIVRDKTLVSHCDLLFNFFIYIMIVRDKTLVSHYDFTFFFIPVNEQRNQAVLM